MTTVPLFDCDNHIYEPPEAGLREVYVRHGIPVAQVCGDCSAQVRINHDLLPQDVCQTPTIPGSSLLQTWGTDHGDRGTSETLL